MFQAPQKIIEPGRITRYLIAREGQTLSYSEVLNLWQADAPFRSFFNGLLADSPFPAFRWETPSLQISSASRPFEFVLLNYPSFAIRRTDHGTYRQYFTNDEDHGVISFLNLSGDAKLIVPSPRTEIDAYGHLASFVRKAPLQQQDALWRVLGSTLKMELGDKPLWVSTAGGGVAWLHLRLDSQPKYYGFAPFKTA